VDADIGRRGRIHIGELLDDDGGVQTAQAAATDLGIHVQTTEPEFPCLGDRLARKDALRIPSRGVRRQFGLGEVTRCLSIGLLRFVEFRRHRVAHGRTPLLLLLTSG